MTGFYTKANIFVTAVMFYAHDILRINESRDTHLYINRAKVDHR